MSIVKDFRDLVAYKIAYAGAMEIFEHSKSWPPEERYALISQIRKSSRAVCGCIAESWA